MPSPQLSSILFAALACAAPFLQAAEASPSPDDARVKWWRDARFGMFIHWNPSSVGGVEISWDRKASRPMEGNTPPGPGADPVYDNYHKSFNPTAFDAKEWVKIAEDAGMKYMVYTAKHHDGFSMWPTKAREGLDISCTPYKNGKGDILRELSDACHAAKMRIGWYYSPRDFTHPDYGSPVSNRKYIDFMSRQIDEIVKNYGKIDILWWDGYGVGNSHTFWHSDEPLAQIRRLQPKMLTNNRCSTYTAYPGGVTVLKDLEGDFDTPEQTIGKYQINRPWESCITLVRDHWAFRPGGHLMSFDWVISTLVTCATGDGNLLLNVGPMPDGRIEPRQVDVLRQVGEWMRKNGEAIYGTRGGPFRNGAWGGATFRGTQSTSTSCLPPRTTSGFRNSIKNSSPTRYFPAEARKSPRRANSSSSKPRRQAAPRRPPSSNSTLTSRSRM